MTGSGEFFTAARVRLASVVIALLAVLAGSAAFAEDDSVVMDKVAKPQKGTIKEISVDGIKIGVEGGEQVITWDKVKQPWTSSITFANAADLNRGLGLLSTGKVEDASQAFMKIAADEKARAVIRQEAIYSLALARQRAGDNDGTVKAYRDLLKSFPKGRYLKTAATNLLSSLLAQRDVDGAAKALEDITNGAKSAGLGEGALSFLALLRGQILESQGKQAEAQAAYEKIAGSSSSDKSTVLGARLGATRCLPAAKADEAERRYRDLVKEADAPNTVLAGAWNGLGELWLKSGSDARDGDKVRDALFAFLRGAVLYVPGAGEPTDEREHALSGTARAFRAVAELESSPEQKKLFLQRATQRREQLKQQYPGSKFQAE